MASNARRTIGTAVAQLPLHSSCVFVTFQPGKDGSVRGPRAQT